MPANKRTNNQRALDLEWIVRQAEEGLSPAAIVRRAQNDIDPDLFDHIEDLDERESAIELERRRRKSVGNLTRQQVGYDLKSMRRRALEQGDKRYQTILQRTIEELTHIGFADLRQVLEWGPHGVAVRDCFELNEADAATVSGVTIKTTKKKTSGGDETVVETRLETHGKLQALGHLLRHLGGNSTAIEMIDTAPIIKEIERAAVLGDDTANEALERIATGESALKTYAEWKRSRNL